MPTKFERPHHSRDAYVTLEDGRKIKTDRLQAGLASEFIYFLPDLVAERGKVDVVLYHRVSRPEQVKNGNLDDGVIEGMRALKALGCRIVGTFEEHSHSSINDIEPEEDYPCNRLEFDLAIECAKKHNAVLVAYKRDRFIRSGFLIPKTKRHEVPTVAEYRKLMKRAQGLTLATILHPSVRGRSEETRRGQSFKNARGGRPLKAAIGPGATKLRRSTFLPRVLQLKAEGLSCRGIVKKVNPELKAKGFKRICVKTVNNWINSVQKAV